MEVGESKQDRSERGILKELGKGDEASLHEVDSSQLLHPEDPQEEPDSSSVSSSSSPEDPVEVLSGNESRSHSVPLDHDAQLELTKYKDKIPDQSNDVAHSTSTIDIPAMQSMERNEVYNPNWIYNSYGGDQAFLLEQEMQTDQKLQKSEEQTSAELVDSKNVCKERKSEETEISQDKIKHPNERVVTLRQDEPKPPNVPLLRTLNSSIQSQGSDSSGYSFSFPIYVSSSALHSSSTKGDSFSPRWIQPKGHHLEAENSVTRQRPPSPNQRTRCCCTRQSWQTCCDLRYWLSFYTCYFCCACLPCYSCCIRCCPCR